MSKTTIEDVLYFEDVRYEICNYLYLWDVINLHLTFKLSIPYEIVKPMEITNQILIQPIVSFQICESCDLIINIDDSCLSGQYGTGYDYKYCDGCGIVMCEDCVIICDYYEDYIGDDNVNCFDCISYCKNCIFKSKEGKNMCYRCHYKRNSNNILTNSNKAL